MDSVYAWAKLWIFDGVIFIKVLLPNFDQNFVARSENDVGFVGKNVA